MTDSTKQAIGIFAMFLLVLGSIVWLIRSNERYDFNEPPIPRAQTIATVPVPSPQPVALTAPKPAKHVFKDDSCHNVPGCPEIVAEYERTQNHAITIIDGQSMISAPPLDGKPML